jgi:hypothetical protein
MSALNNSLYLSLAFLLGREPIFWRADKNTELFTVRMAHWRLAEALKK